MKSNSPPSINGIQVPYSASFTELKAYLEQPGPQAWAAFIALGHNSSAEALELLVQFSLSDDWRYRRSAIEALAYNSQARDVADLILKALLDESPFVVRTACEVCARLQLENCHELLLEVLDSRGSATRMAALGALKLLWQPADLARLVKIAKEDSNEDVRRSANWTLRSNAGPDNWKAMYEIWKDDHLPRHRVWACELAAQYGDSQDAGLIADLEELSHDPDGHVRKTAERVLRGIRTTT